MNLELANDSALRQGRFMIRIPQRFKKMTYNCRSKELRWHITYIESSFEISPSETSPLATISSPGRCSAAFLFSLKLMVQTTTLHHLPNCPKVGSNVELATH